MQTATRNLKRVVIAGALATALSASSLAMVAAQEATATPEAPAAETAQAERAFLGVRLADLADVDAGVTVLLVLPGSPAEAAGLAEGDVITAVNGTEVDSAQAIADAISGLAVGDAVELGVSRGSEALTLEATLAAASEFDAQTETAVIPFGNNVNDDVVLRFGADDQAWGVVQLSEDSPLYEAGLREGDLITTIDGSSYNPMTLLAYIGSLGPDATVTLNVARSGGDVEVTVPVSDFAGAALMGSGMMPSFGMEQGQQGQGQSPRGDRGHGQGQQGGQQNGMPFQQMIPGHGFGMFSAMAANGRLGLAFVTLDETVAAEQGTDLTDGAYVVEVEADSPAATAGVAAGDVVLAVNGEAVDAEHTLRDRMVAYEPGDVVTLTINRAGEELQIEVTLGEPVAMQGGQFFNFEGGMMPGMMDQLFGQGGNSQGLPPWHPEVPAQPEATPEASGSNA